MSGWKSLVSRKEFSTFQKTWQKQHKNDLVKRLWDFTTQNCVNMKQRISMWTKTS